MIISYLAAEIQQAAKGQRRIDQVKPSKARKARGSNPKVMFEFCCSEGSALGKANKERNIGHIRLTEKSSDMSNDKEVRDLLKVMKMFPGADLWGPIPCGPWSPWQDLILQRVVRGMQRDSKPHVRSPENLEKLHTLCRAGVARWWTYEL